MPKTFAYLKSRAQEKILQRLLRSKFPTGTRFSIAAFENVEAVSDFSHGVGSETAFVFQGPIAANFENIYQKYRNLFPKSPIVISTWANQKSHAENLQEDSITKFVFTDPPLERGIMNVNLQLVSTERGISKIASTFPHVVRVAKIRMDYPPLTPDAIFPIIDHFDEAFPTDGRIWGIDVNTIMNLPYSFSDIFQIGSIEAMQNFWHEDSFDPRTITPNEFLERTDNQKNIDAVIALRPAEMHLTICYLERRGESVRPTDLEQYRNFLGQYFGILDADQIGLAFDKYTPLRNGRHRSEFSEKRFASMAEWVTLATQVRGLT